MTVADLAQLTLEEKALLTAGTDLWHTAAIARLDIPALRLTDGPSGARGERWSSGTSACMPSGSALGATWNRELVRRVGQALANEARAKGAQVLLAPTVNIHRHPLGGRHFECYSEDPLLTAELSTAYIEGVQERGVAAVVKHFVCNDQEFERHTISIEVDERTLREIYLPPFESAVLRAHVWSVMGAYNRLHGVYCCEHSGLLQDLLKNEWGFDGLVMSDWHATHSTAAVATGLDLEMPGPARHLGAHLSKAVARGEIPEGAVDDAVERMLRLMSRVEHARNGSIGGESVAALARAAAAESIVLLKNDPPAGATTPLLPLDLERVRRIAVIGPMADRPSAQGGGSAEVTPAYVVSPVEALRARVGDRVELHVERGCNLPGLPLMDASLRRGPLHVEYFANRHFEGLSAGAEDYTQSRMFWTAPPVAGLTMGQFSARATTTFVPDRDATWRFGLASAGQSRLFMDGALVVDNFDPQPGETFFGRGSRLVTGDIELRGDTEYRFELEFRASENLPTAGVLIGADSVQTSDSIERAARAAANADLALLVVGYDGQWESEGFDRPHMDLPGQQDELIRAVLAANPRGVVVLNTGSPVSMPWADDAAALLQLWFSGMELGNSLLDVLVGDANPSGRLPTSFPRTLDDVPANYPGVDGVLRYTEGVFVGYRHYDTRGVDPRFCFGHGLSYTQFDYTNLSTTVSGSDVRVSVDVTNTGARGGQEVVQLYVRDLESSVERPDKELRAFDKVTLQPAETRTVHFDLAARAFAFWSTPDHDWRVEPGEFEILVGASSRDVRATTRVRL